MKVLFLPFLQIPSGHHHAADAISSYFKQLDPSIQCKKVDILHHTFGYGEKVISNLYLYAIQTMPAFYSWLYKNKAYDRIKSNKTFYFYELLFLNSLKNLLKKEKPDLVICTHSLPSHLLNHLKHKNNLSIPVINVYTDFFVNILWGIQHIDVHFVPSVKIKQYLESKNVKPDRIFVTGIPVHPKIKKKKERFEQKSEFHVLIAAGNLGVAPIESFFQKNKPSTKIKYHVLCGKNKKLFKKINQLGNPNIIPIAYISCKEEMNSLYDQMDLVLTKPGGVTISECLLKHIPMFIVHTLPGQEELNEAFLLKHDLVLNKIYPLQKDQLDKTLLSFLENTDKRQKHQEKLNEYMKSQVDMMDVIKQLFSQDIHKRLFGE
ncbi:MGDG synthase family glycosyltransferase [Bacillus chungangensis]|uniref:UDP-N-acetylglucosamine:LPS N-acetylglucosamine transferase n=1 Tax=Bacillus chungangensis TaxID=587633 RepID=A0ABT9WQG7_9BACI|nr:glycosyltransferase [Bacillus chungangensis]MDQ0175467.1 UDP-N-acetylglucosamine:LPS N-acetylglucosamine transferase [Bacillus chungangensis]